MKRPLMIAVLVMTVSMLGATAAWAGSAAGDTYSSFSGPSLSGTVVLNPDAVTAGPVPKGTVGIQVTRGSTSAGVLYVSSYVVNFHNGCAGPRGPAIASGVAWEAQSTKRFLGLAR